MDAAFGRARLVLNCTGPYRFLGEQASSCGLCGVLVLELVRLRSTGSAHPISIHPSIYQSINQSPPLQVVTACLRAGTDYMDLCGEPEFMDRMLLKYHEEARAKGVSS